MAATSVSALPGRGTRRATTWITGSVMLALPYFQDDLAAGVGALDAAVRLGQDGGVDRRQRFGDGGADAAAFDQLGDRVEQPPLFGDVGRVEQRAGEHQLPMYR